MARGIMDDRPHRADGDVAVHVLAILSAPTAKRGAALAPDCARPEPLAIPKPSACFGIRFGGDRQGPEREFLKTLHDIHKTVGGSPSLAGSSSAERPPEAIPIPGDDDREEGAVDLYKLYRPRRFDPQDQLCRRAYRVTSTPRAR